MSTSRSPSATSKVATSGWIPPHLRPRTALQSKDANAKLNNHVIGKSCDAADPRHLNNMPLDGSLSVQPPSHPAGCEQPAVCSNVVEQTDHRSYEPSTVTSETYANNNTSNLPVLPPQPVAELLSKIETLARECCAISPPRVNQFQPHGKIHFGQEGCNDFRKTVVTSDQHAAPPSQSTNSHDPKPVRSVLIKDDSEDADGFWEPPFEESKPWSPGRVEITTPKQKQPVRSQQQTKAKPPVTSLQPSSSQSLGKSSPPTNQSKMSYSAALGSGQATTNRQADRKVKAPQSVKRASNTKEWTSDEGNRQGQSAETWDNMYDRDRARNVNPSNQGRIASPFPLDLSHIGKNRRKGGWETKEERRARRENEKKYSRELEEEGWYANLLTPSSNPFYKEADPDHINRFEDYDAQQAVDRDFAIRGLLGRSAEDRAYAETLEKDPYFSIRHLVQWDGTWAPVVPEWQERQKFAKLNMWEYMFQWIDASEREQETELEGDPADLTNMRNRIKKPIVDMTSEFFVRKPRIDPLREDVIPDQEDFSREIAPKYWLPVDHTGRPTIDNMPRERWWRERAKFSPQFADEEDFDPAAKPFWRKYAKEHAGDKVVANLNVLHDCFMAKHDPGSAEFVCDPDDEEPDSFERCRAWPGTSNEEVEFYVVNKGRTPQEMEAARKKTSNEQRPLAKEEKIAKQRLEMMDFSPPDRNTPHINLFIREALPIDVGQITAIWNHYQQNTVYVAEHDPFTEQQVQVRLRDVRADRCSFLVAVERGHINKLPRYNGKSRVIQPNGEEKILGFAFIDMICRRGDTWQATAEAEVYTHPEQLCKKVGKNLLNRLIQQHDPYFPPKNWSEYRPSSNAYQPRPFANITMNIPYASERETGRVKSMAYFLKEFEFEYQGTVKDKGAKRGEWVSEAIFMRRNGQLHNAHYYSMKNT